MIIIKKLRDIDQLYRNITLHKPIIDYIKNYFLNIYSTFSDCEDLHQFTLDSSGYIVVLQTADDVAHLAETGLTRGLTASVPEYVNKVILVDCGQPLEIYHALFLTNNEWGLNVVSIVGSLDDASETFLRENCD